jgi:hypothetical protein
MPKKMNFNKHMSKSNQTLEILLLLSIGINLMVSGPSYITGLMVVILAANKSIEMTK